ncbi:SMC-Scp complex subunit ScpB [Gleimia sp. 6138-11-ORH1]|uniref:SMC-Scp complex subunit ScpB n=1 Tax=Gleimia sp. 6138-11-ORH1 TaxID=2973937 RepID=UPI002168F246|nr:SMC-Scp complex subunit ScpB [Gleimia sp. 6138-11-ORH1]MCS4484335.1 SMC-Scp complex subunit ScpB [Gleimia sp. 6138-11-ORH1]
MSTQFSSQEIPIAEQKKIVEAILIVAETPVTVPYLAEIIQTDTVTVEKHLNELAEEFNQRGFILKPAGTGWRFYSNPKYAEYVKQFVVGSENQKLSQAALETLAIIAYRQPISKGKISSIRGVNVDSVVRNLAARRLIDEVGYSSTGATLWGTTEVFLEKMGLSNLTELAPLAPFLPAAEELEELAEEI